MSCLRSILEGGNPSGLANGAAAWSSSFVAALEFGSSADGFSDPNESHMSQAEQHLQKGGISAGKALYLRHIFHLYQ